MSCSETLTVLSKGDVILSHLSEREDPMVPYLIFDECLVTHYNGKATHEKSLKTGLIYPLAFVKRGELIPLLMLLDNSSH